MSLFKRISHLIVVAGAFAFAQPAVAASAPQQAGVQSSVEAVPGLSNFAPFAAAATHEVGVQVADASGALAIPSRAQASAPDADFSLVQNYVEGRSGDKPIVVALNTAKKEGKDLSASKGGGEALYIGSMACAKCHRGQFGNFAVTLHGEIFLKKPRTPMERQGCEACHGPGSRHAISKESDNGAPGDIISFRKDSPRPVTERNAICLTCHERGDRTYWAGSTHETQGLACTSCHQLMEKVSVKHQLVKSTEAEVCFQCHKDRRAQFIRSAHMPLINGSMTCSSCHNPHGSATDKLLRGASVNEVCYQCHADKRGPFLWEHEPVRDSCLNCHEPHGTINEYMLKVQRPRLCSLCHQGVGHGMPGNPRIIQSFDRSCQNCHTKVHGSNSPAGMLFQR
ncbi:DmsE family decaheme c-type cytochrome [Rhodoblastus sp.]|uniref:DmsE family decaheme c-type cytochrome n=1 Tax=Rhodoblastus sp. TaxID=1962975 RepID=UPI003F991153